MVATIKRVPGLYLTAAPGAPSIVPTAEEDRIARLPGLVHYIEPDRMTGSPLSARDRATPGHLIATTDATITLGAQAAYGGRQVLSKPNPNAPLALTEGSVTPSWTIIIAADIAAARYGAGSTTNLFGTRGLNGNIEANFRFASGGWTFEDDYDASGGHVLPLASGPLADVPAVWAISYDAATRTSRISLNSADVLSSYVHANAWVPPTPSTQWLIGGTNFGSANWQGRLGRALIFDRAYHLEPYTALLAREVAALRTYYGLV